MNKYLLKNQNEFGYTRKIIYLQDKIKNILVEEMIKLNIDHSLDNESLMHEVLFYKTPGYGFINDEIVVFEPYDNIQKARERIFEILCHFRILFEHYGRFTLECSSVDDNEFFLISLTDTILKLISSYILENGLIKIVISKDVFKYFTSYYLPFKLRKYKFGLIVLDANQSTVKHTIKNYISNYMFFAPYSNKSEERKEEIKNELIPYYLIVSNGLSKKNKVKLINCIDDSKLIFDLESLDRYLELFDKKMDGLIYSNTLKKYLENIENCSKDLCKNCATSLAKKHTVVKNFAQTLNIKTCKCCNSNKEVFAYLVK